MSATANDRNLLFVILALQMDFIGRDAGTLLGRWPETIRGRPFIGPVPFAGLTDASSEHVRHAFLGGWLNLQ